MLTLTFDSPCQRPDPGHGRRLLPRPPRVARTSMIRARPGQALVGFEKKKKKNEETNKTPLLSTFAPASTQKSRSGDVLMLNVQVAATIDVYDWMIENDADDVERKTLL